MESLKLKVEIENPTSQEKLTELSKLFNEIAYWNRNGVSIYTRNQDGTMGDEKSQSLAKQTSYPQFVLISLCAELKTLLPSFLIGKGGSHIWVKNTSNDYRILSIYF